VEVVVVVVTCYHDNIVGAMDEGVWGVGVERGQERMHRKKIKTNKKHKRINIKMHAASGDLDRSDSGEERLEQRIILG
jgi:hypothetical protein